MRRPRLAVFISGRGSNLAVLLELRSVLDVVLVVSSKPNAPGLIRARRAGVRTQVLEKKVDWPALDALLRSHQIELIVLAGFMKIVPEEFVLSWREKIINLHPSLLPKFPGLNAIEQAFAAQEEIGVTLHWVNEILDGGKIIAQRKVINKRSLSRYSLAQAEFLVHVSEHRLMREVFSKCKTISIWS